MSGMLAAQAFDYSVPEGVDVDREVARIPMLSDYRRELESMTDEELLLLRMKMKWRSMAREKQLPPKDFDELRKAIWIIITGRGFGKTFCAANWLGGEAASTPNSYWFVVAPTHDDVKFTCFFGPTGLLSVIPPKLVRDVNLSGPSCLLWNNAFIRGFAGDTPERLRGPQHHGGWCDEIASWRYPDAAWDNIQFGLRLGEFPRMVCTGTPKPTPFMRNLVKNKSAVIVRGTTYENRENLTQAFYDNVAKYEGTKIGRQELEGEILDPEEEGVVRRSEWGLWPNKMPLPNFQLIVMSLDTAFTERQYDKKKQQNDPTACSVWGMFGMTKEIADRLVKEQVVRKRPKVGERHVLMLDCWEDWLGFDDLVARVKKERKIRYGDAGEPMIKVKVLPKNQQAGPQGKAVDIILIEDKGSGISLRQALAKEEILATPYNPGNMDKLSRLHVVSPMFAHERVWAVESDRMPGQFKAWAEPMVSQVCSYMGEGSTEHDDLLDTCTQALKFISDSSFEALTVKRDPEEEKRRAALDAQETKRMRRNPYGS